MRGVWQHDQKPGLISPCYSLDKQKCFGKAHLTFRPSTSAPVPPSYPFLSQGISVAATGNWHRPDAPQVVIQVVVPPRCISSSNRSKVQPKRFGLAPAFPSAFPLQQPWWALLRQHQQQRQAPSAKSCQHHWGGQLERVLGLHLQKV